MELAWICRLPISAFLFVYRAVDGEYCFVTHDEEPSEVSVCAPSVGNNGCATLCAQQLIHGRFAVYMGENANQSVKFVAHFCPTNSRVGNPAALINVDSSPRLFSHAGYFQVTRRCFDGYGL
jgi:hypothetical protein